MWKRIALVVLAALMLGGRAHAAPQPTTKELAAQVVQAFEKGDTEAVRQVVHGPRTEAWLLAEELLEQGHNDAARAVANARDWTHLEAYVAWRPNHAPRSKIVESLDILLKQPGMDRKAWLKTYEPLLEKEGRGVRWTRFLGRVAQSLFKIDRIDDAIAMYERAGRAAAKIGWRREQVRMVGYAAGTSRRARKYDDAVRLTKQRVEAAREAGDDRLHFNVLLQSAYACRNMSRLDEARRFAKAAEAIADSLEASRRAARERIFVELAAGDTYTVARLLPNLRELEFRSGPGRALNVASCDLQLALAEATLARFTNVLGRLAGAMAYYEQHAGPKQRYVAHISAGKIHLLMRDNERALHHVTEARKAVGGQRGAQDVALEASALSYLGRLDEAITVFKETMTHIDANDHSRVVAANINLAQLLARTGRAAEAEPYLAAAHKSLDRVSDQSIHAHVYVAESVVHERNEKWDLAIEAATKASEINERLMERQLRAVNEGTLARCWLSKDDDERAIVHATNALNYVLTRSAALPERIGAQFRSALRDSFELALFAALRLSDREKFFQFAEQAAAVSLRNRLGTQEMVLHAFPAQLRERELELQESETKAVASYRAVVRLGDREARKRALAVVGRVRELLDRHRERLRAEQVAASQVVDPTVDSLAATQARLGPDEALVILIQSVENVYAFVVTAKDSRGINLRDRAAMNAMVDELALEDETSPWKESIASLRKKIAKPLGLDQGLKRLTIVPTGQLAHVPFAAIWPKRSVRLVPSATIDRLLQARDPKPGKGVLAVADPESADGRRLPGAREEAQAVGDEQLLGKAATEARLEQAIASRERWHAVHIACHGLIDPVNPLRSALSLSPADKRDGLWTVSEILQAKVSTDLVVLGACSTGRGKTFDQEGALGFVQAFFVAGAKRVLVSLWDVDDKATSALLQRFHSEWKPGTSPALALQKAQSWLRTTHKQWSHPAFWAAWQLWGPQ